MNKQEAVKALYAGDHAFFTPEHATKIATAFDMPITPQRVRANTGAPKGLEVDGARRGQFVEGYDATDLACKIGYYIGANMGEAEMMYGRGSRLRAACAAIEKKLARGTK